MNTQKTEAENRQTIIHALDKNLFIEAGAGAGKTTLLVERAVNLLSQDNVQPSQVVIITFTNAAASELYDRIVKKLRSRVKEQPTEQLKNCLDHIDQMNISTIHHFCNMLLRQRIFEAGLGMNANYSEEDTTIEAKTNFLVNALSGNGMSDSDKEKLVDELQELKTILGYSYKDDIQSLFMMMSDKEDAEYFVDDQLLDNRTWQSFEDDARNILNSEEIHQLKRINQEMLDAFNELSFKTADARAQKNMYYSGVYALLNSIEKNIALYDEKKSQDIIPVLSQLGSSKLVSPFKLKPSNQLTSTKKAEKEALASKKNEYSAKADKENNDFNEILTKLLEEKINPLKAEIEAYQAGKAIRFTEKFAKRYQAERDQSQISNDTLLYRTRDLLCNKDNVNARKILADKYRYIFVDEYQDTDQVQTDIILSLTRKDDNTDQLRPGSLVVVGDPKQSIYRFRGADSSLFGKMKERFKKYQEADPEHNEVIDLHDNYRSNEEVIDWANKNYQDQYENYVEMSVSDQRKEAGFPDDTLHGLYVSYVETKDDRAAKKADKSKKSEKKTDADHLVELIQNLTNGKEKILTRTDNGYTAREINYSDILVLTWRRKPIKKYVNAFKDNNIPVSVLGLVDVNSVPMRRLVSIIRYLANTQNQVKEAEAVQALYGTDLPVVSHDDYKNIRQKNLYDFTSLLNDYNMPSLISSILHPEVKKQTKGNQTKEEQKKPADIVVKRGLYDLSELARHKNACAVIRYLINHEEFLFDRNQDIPAETYYDQRKQLQNLVESMEQAGISEMSEAADYLEKYMEADHDKEAEYLPGRNQVRIMNVHKSKGLQAPVVILIQDKQKDKKNNYQEGNQYYVVLNRMNSQLASYADKDEILQKAEQASREDERNKEYVADTRAQEVMIYMQAKQPDDDSDQKDTDDKIKAIDQLPIIDNLIRPASAQTTADASDQENTTNNNIRTINSSDLFENRKKGVIEQEKLAVNVFNSVTPSAFENTQSSEKSETVEKKERPNGAVFGIVMHRCFELFVNRRRQIAEEKDRTSSLRAIVAQAVMENISDIKSEEIPGYQNYLLQVLKDYGNDAAVMKQIDDAEEVYTELPFSYYVKKEDSETLIKALQNAITGNKNKEKLDFDSNTLYIHGACDLVLKNKDNSITVLDYKSDECFESDKEKFKAKKAEKYQGQLILYRYAMSNVFNIDLNQIKTELYLVDIHELQPVDIQ